MHPITIFINRRTVNIDQKNSLNSHMGNSYIYIMVVRNNVQIFIHRIKITPLSLRS